MNSYESALETCYANHDMLISPKNAAKILGVDEALLHRRIWCGQLPVCIGINGIKQILLSHAQRIAQADND